MKRVLKKSNAQSSGTIDKETTQEDRNHSWIKGLPMNRRMMPQATQTFTMSGRV